RPTVVAGRRRKGSNAARRWPRSAGQGWKADSPWLRRRAFQQGWVRGSSRVSQDIVADAGLESARRYFAQRRHRRGARIQRIGTAGSEDAARRWIDGTRDIAFEQTPAAAGFRIRPRRRF